MGCSKITPDENVRDWFTLFAAAARFIVYITSTWRLTLNNSLKNGLHADRTTLCAWRRWPSQAMVTSVKSSSSLRASNWDVMFAWKLFHLRQNCWSSDTDIVEIKRDAVDRLKSPSPVKGSGYGCDHFTYLWSSQTKINLLISINNTTYFFLPPTLKKYNSRRYKLWKKLWEIKYIREVI